MQRMSGLPPTHPYPMYASDLERPLTDADVLVHRSMHTRDTPASRVFFSTQNVDALQLQLRSEVFNATKLTIDRQSDDALLTVMRWVFIEYASNAAHPTPQAIDAEVKQLNSVVIRHVLPDVIANLAQYLGYLRDASRLPEPAPRGQQTSMRGTKTSDMFRPV